MDGDTKELRTRNVGIRRVKVRDLEDAPWNFRTHPTQQVDALEGAIEELGGEYSPYVPSSLDTGIKCAVVDAGASRPLRNRKSLSPVFNKHVLPRVARLFRTSCPAAVAGFVVAVVVLAVYFVPWWSLTHIGKEVTEPVLSKPPLADSNATPAVIGEVLAPQVAAAVLHGSPRFILPRHLAANGSTVGDIPGGKLVSLQAPAAFRVVTDKIFLGDDFLGAAFALALPAPPTLNANRCDWGESPERYPGDVFRRAVSPSILNIRHDVALLNSVTVWIEPSDVSASVGSLHCNAQL